MQNLSGCLSLLRCPVTGRPLSLVDGVLRQEESGTEYRINRLGIPLFGEQRCSEEARIQQAHYDSVTQGYIANLGYPHTQEYTAYLDRALLKEIDFSQLGTVAELCCGRGEAMGLIGDRIGRGVAVDISTAMLEAAVRDFENTPSIVFLQGDATLLPLADEEFDSVFILGGVHHINNRRKLFSEVYRILKPGGAFYFREPYSGFLLWRALRAVIYRLSPALDHATERPLVSEETLPVLDEAGFRIESYRTYGLFGFCLFMNSDVLVFNRLFRFVPGIRRLTRLVAHLDDWILTIPGLKEAGLQIICKAVKPSSTLERSSSVRR